MNKILAGKVCSNKPERPAETTKIKSNFNVVVIIDEMIAY
jgi:hypothetical protein